MAHLAHLTTGRRKIVDSKRRRQKDEPHQQTAGYQSHRLFVVSFRIKSFFSSTLHFFSRPNSDPHNYLSFHHRTERYGHLCRQEKETTANHVQHSPCMPSDN